MQSEKASPRAGFSFCRKKLYFFREATKVVRAFAWPAASNALLAWGSCSPPSAMKPATGPRVSEVSLERGTHLAIARSAVAHGALDL